MDEKQIKNLIVRILEKIDMHSKEAEDLVYRTGKVESGYRYIRQIRGPARGLFQCEPWVAVDICKNYLSYRSDLMKKVAKATEVKLSHFTQPTEQNWAFILETNLAAQIAMCRLHYRRIPTKLPNTVKEQAVYWKKYYNSSAGRGTVEDFLERIA
jgi:hypothetical protein|tara:strand:+ start:63 stop:527 length:465 start_codon:yes stop_codon:yes gene_type:complete